MNLKEIMTSDEQDITDRLIRAHLIVQNAKLALHDVETAKAQIAKEFTEAWWRSDEEDNLVATIPESFVAYSQGIPYFIEVDTEGGHKHDITMIGGVLNG